MTALPDEKLLSHMRTIHEKALLMTIQVIYYVQRNQCIPKNRDMNTEWRSKLVLENFLTKCRRFQKKNLTCSKKSTRKSDGR